MTLEILIYQIIWEMTELRSKIMCLRRTNHVTDRFLLSPYILIVVYTLLVATT